MGWLSGLGHGSPPCGRSANDKLQSWTQTRSHPKGKRLRETTGGDRCLSLPLLFCRGCRWQSELREKADPARREGPLHIPPFLAPGGSAR